MPFRRCERHVSARKRTKSVLDACWRHALWRRNDLVIVGEGEARGEEATPGSDGPG